MARVLVFQSNPDDATKLRIDRELRAINACISPFAQNTFLITQVGAVERADFYKYFLTGGIDVFHFSGHGTKKGIIVEDHEGDGDTLSNEFLEVLFREIGGSIKCVVLNSCYSKAQATIISKYVPYVIGTSSSLFDAHAITFASSFYRALSHGLDIEASFVLARTEIASNKIKKTEIPSLFKSKSSFKKEFLYRKPILKAEFELNRNGKPVRDDGTYSFKVWMENVPSDSVSVVFNFNHEEMEEEYTYVEAINDGTGYATEIDLYGNIQIRVMIWGKDKGVGFTDTLHNALSNHYNLTKKRDRSIDSALLEILSN